MAQVFHRSANAIARSSIIIVLLLVALGGYVLDALSRSHYITNQNIPLQQPVMFRHRHHSGDDGIDCRYCHQHVDKAATAGMPPTKTCMNCHSQLWANSPFLEPIRESWRTEVPIKWVRVHDLPDFVYFNHSIHVNKGVGCVQCHGAVERMQLTFQVSSLQMEWCLSCHREPEKFLMPKDQIYNTLWTPPANQLEVGRQLKAEYKIREGDILTACSTCHR